MKIEFRNLVLLALIVLAGVSPAFAQTTATVTGTVTTDGAPLPGATVTITSPQMQGNRTTVTGDAGGYNFSGIPAGDYTVTIELAGMTSATRKVQVGPGQTGRADADLRVSAVSEAITVTASAPSVLETPTVSQNIQQELVEELPIARTVNAAALLAPGVTGNTTANNQFSISGSPGYDNLIMVNGVVISEAVRSQILPLYIEDAIQETTIMTGGVSAEYGRFTGGVINSITKSGGNEFSGSLRDSFTSPDWSDENPLQITPAQQNVHKLGQVWEATLGGYILRDRLWFFAAGRDTETDNPVATRLVPGDTTNTSLTSSSVTTETRYEGKLTGQLTPSHTLMGSYFESESVQTNYQFTPASYDLESLSPDRQDPRELLTARYNGIFATNLMIEAQFTDMEWGVSLGGGARFTDPIRGTIVRNRADANARFNSPTFCGVCDKEYRSNDSKQLKANYFLSNRGIGNHNLVAGWEDFSEHRYANNYQSGSNYRLFVNSVTRIGNELYPVIQPGKGGTATYFVHTPIFSLQNNESDLSTQSLYVNDRWDLNQHWSFNLGVRYDKNDAVDSSGNVSSDDSKFSPRLSSTFDVLGNGRHRVTASYSEYASRIVEGPGTAASAAGNPAYIYYMYNGPEINTGGTPTLNTRQALEQVFAWFLNQCNAAGKCGPDNLDLLRENSSHDVPGFSNRIGDNLSSPYVREITLGYGAQLGTNAFARVDLVARDWKDFYAFRITRESNQVVTDNLGIPHDLAIVENTDDIERTYRGIQTQFAWRPNRFNLGLNYTWSKLRGNDEQETATSGTVGNYPSSIYYPELNDYRQYQPVGYLNADQRHKARAWIGYDVPLPRFLGMLNVTALQSFDTGTAYSAALFPPPLGAGLNVSNYFNQLIAGTGYKSASDLGQYYFSERGAFRLDDVSSTDVALNYTMPIGRFALFAQGEALNIFNRKTATVVNTTVTQLQQFNPFTDKPVECTPALAGTTGRPTNAQCIAAGAHWIKGANFGRPTSATASIPANAFTSNFQVARTYRFSVGFRF
ncbi:MAG TPA: TonB-dependent receptor [Thermoanaerobaculia bacterium]|jgi:outer membrane receptor protein involved in Fe transport